MIYKKSANTACSAVLIKNNTDFYFHIIIG